jgi:nucleotide-binding universal stress UspA family protein
MRNNGPVALALDGSSESERALSYAAALARLVSAPLALFSVVEPEPGDLETVFPSVAAELRETARARIAEYLADAAARAGDGIAVETHVRSGDAADEILAFAEESGARAIALSSHGRSGIGRWFYGSTAGRLLREASAPLLVVGPNVNTEPRYDRVLVPLDGSPLAERAIPVARQLLGSSEAARIVLGRAIKWAAQAYPYTFPDAYLPQIDEAIEKDANQYLVTIAERLGSNVAAFVLRGPAAEALLDFVERERIDLVVMTTRGRTGITRAALGSVADRMLQGRAPVLLIPPDAPA